MEAIFQLLQRPSRVPCQMAVCLSKQRYELKKVFGNQAKHNSTKCHIKKIQRIPKSRNSWGQINSTRIVRRRRLVRSFVIFCCCVDSAQQITFLDSFETYSSWLKVNELLSPELGQIWLSPRSNRIELEFLSPNWAWALFFKLKSGPKLSQVLHMGAFKLLSLFWAPYVDRARRSSLPSFSQFSIGLS